MSHLNPDHANITPIQIGNPQGRYHHQTGPGQLNPELISRIDVAALVDLLMREEWKGRCEIVPNYVAPYSKQGEKPRVVVRYRVRARSEHEEDSYSYLRCNGGALQGFFWDIYGDDLGTVELALMALHQAPAPVYTGPIVTRFETKRKE